MVVIGHKLQTFVSGFLALVSLFGIIYMLYRGFDDPLYSGFNDPDDWWLFPSCVISFLGMATFSLSFFPNFKIIFDDSAITVEQEMNFLFFNILKKTRTVPWSEVFIDYYSFKEGFFFYDSEGSLFTQTNHKKGLEYAVKKLPKDKFTEDAQKKLRKMGIAI